MDWHLRTIVAVLAAATSLGYVQGLSRMELMYTWGTVTFVFESEQQRLQMEANGTYKPGNSVPFDVDVGGPNRNVFIAMPWLVDGSPVTLATVQNVEQRDSPLVPYPDWSWHAGARGCDGLTSIFRIKVDRCDRLWVIDSGIADITSTFRRECPAQLVVFNLTTNELLVRHRFDAPEASCLQSQMLTVAVEQMGDSCSDDAYAYVADAGAFALYVYSLRSDSSWRVPSELFFPDVNSRRLNVAGTSFVLMDGVLGLAVSPRLEGESEDRLLFFHALTSVQEGMVRTSILRNQSLFADGFNGASDDFQFIGRHKCQAAGNGMTSNGVLFYSPVCDNTIVCWNSRRPYKRYYQDVVERDNERLRFVTNIKVVSGEDVWAVANNAQLLFSGQFRGTTPNYVNIVRGNVTDLVRGTNC